MSDSTASGISFRVFSRGAISLEFIWSRNSLAWSWRTCAKVAAPQETSGVSSRWSRQWCVALTKRQTQRSLPPYTLNTPYTPHNSHETTLVVGEHTERLSAAPVGEACALLMGVGGWAVGRRDGRRLPHWGGSTVTTDHFIHHIIIYTVIYIDRGTPWHDPEEPVQKWLHHKRQVVWAVGGADSNVWHWRRDRLRDPLPSPTHSTLSPTHSTLSPPHNSHETTLVEEEHIERLSAAPVGEACALLMGVEGRAVVRRDCGRLPHRDGSTVTTEHFMHHIHGVAPSWGVQSKRPLDVSVCVDCVAVKGVMEKTVVKENRAEKIQA